MFVQTLRFFVALIFGCVLLTGVQAHAPAAGSKNDAVRYLSDAELQYETKAQAREIRRALRDALKVPASKLRERRYANYQMEPNQWTFGALVQSYFISREDISAESDKFYEDVKKPDAKPILKHWLAKVAKLSGAGD